MRTRVTVTSRLLQEMIVRDSPGWDLGPELDHFSSRTRQVLQYMNPNKINMDLLVELIAYIGTSHHAGSALGKPAGLRCVKYVRVCVFFCQKSPRSLRRWTAPFSFFFPGWLTSSSSSTCFPQTRDSETETGEATVLCFQ